MAGGLALSGRYCLAITGEVFSYLRDNSSSSLPTWKNILMRGVVYARIFACFKFMALYSMIQFTSCCIFYVYNINLTDGQFLFIDLFTILPIAICMDRTKPFDKLVAKRPSASLVSKKVLTSLIGNVILVVVFQIAVFLVLRAQAWYEKPHATDPSDPDSIPIKGVLNTTIFVFSVFQYVFAGLIFSIGPPYRQPVYRNYIYLAVITVLLAFDLWVLLGPVPGFTSLFGIVHLKVWWRLFILGMVAANLVLCVLGEWLVFPMVARPLAKIFRLFGYLFDRYGCAWQGEKLSDEEAHLHYYGRSSKTAADASLWSRLGQRRNRKEYKVLLESMPGGSSFY
ncbi:hypothetical protein GGI07_005031 [Coemansia sp. Benny D115]|nr:hypothetical protein GGI07_005031 [Coemansia sp. Benny D115]